MGAASIIITLKKVNLDYGFKIEHYFNTREVKHSHLCELECCFQCPYKYKNS